MKNDVMTYFLLMLALVVIGCTSDKAVHGNPLEIQKFSRLTIGETTKQDIRNLFGSPTSVNITTDNLWYYIGQRVEKVAFLQPNILEAVTVVLQFDDNDLLKRIQHFGQEHFQDVPFTARETLTTGHEVSLFEIIFGNLGVGTLDSLYSPTRELP